MELRTLLITLTIFWIFWSIWKKKNKYLKYKNIVQNLKLNIPSKCSHKITPRAIDSFGKLINELLIAILESRHHHYGHYTRRVRVAGWAGGNGTERKIRDGGLYHCNMIREDLFLVDDACLGTVKHNRRSMRMKLYTRTLAWG